MSSIQTAWPCNLVSSWATNSPTLLNAQSTAPTNQPTQRCALMITITRPLCMTEAQVPSPDYCMVQYLPTLATTVTPCSKGPVRPRMIISDKIPTFSISEHTAPCQIKVLQQMEKIIHGPTQTNVIVAAGCSQASEPQAQDTLFKSLVPTLGCPCQPNYWQMDRKQRPWVYWDSRREELKNQCWLSQDQEPAWWEESIGYVNLKTAFL